jgi:hypothetical protein
VEGTKDEEGEEGLATKPPADEVDMVSMVLMTRAGHVDHPAVTASGVAKNSNRV